MKKITLHPLDSSEVQGTTSIQPQMVAGGYQNTLRTHNSFLGYFWGKPFTMEC